MPGKNIRFGDYSSNVSKGKITEHRNVFFSGYYMVENSDRTVTIKQFGPNNTSASLNYEQNCIVKRYRTFRDEELDTRSIKRIIAPHIGRLEFNNKRWHLNELELVDDAGNTFRIESRTIVFNNKIVAEYVLNYSRSFLREADYIWLDETQTSETKMIVATLLTYLSTVQPLPC
ncbi:hypothetical protein HC752_05525 [Vibrio sp. S9_S30]|uniref:hypothetical protein n=1 Tax=Vibrio sp. S9_S30 TaxID=2720226 RepID=UPI001680C171|nr:hypothetical protein [Vibrio sp. S9_S30]MBD1556390.1 hypothetical protein [Vibrio sp. S9_S30]